MSLRVDVLGVPVAATTFEQALDRVEGFIATSTPAFVTFTGVHGVMESQADPDLLRIHQEATIVCPDGMPMVWAARRAGFAEAERVYGPDFLLAMSERAAAAGHRTFFYGGAEGVAEQLAEALTARYPGLPVVGCYCPPFRPLTDDEKVDVEAMIRQSGADLVWVGLSTPKQERWMSEWVARLDGPVLLGVGAAFDIHSGNLKQAPAWMQQRGLEWAYRFAVEPKRLWRRYLKNNPRFVVSILRRPPRLLQDGEVPSPA